MAADYEWVLTTPKVRDFARQNTIEVLVDNEKTQVTETVTVSQQANVVRLTATHNDIPNQRLFVRFYYGRLENGVFVTPVLDDGVVFGGPTYIDHEFHEDPTALEEEILLKKIAEALAWDGAMRPVNAP